MFNISWGSWAMGIVALVALGAFGALGCGDAANASSSGLDEGAVGEVSIELTSVPPLVRCIAIDTTRTPGGASTRKTFSVVANAASSNLSLGRFTLGAMQITGSAWDLDCMDAQLATTLPSWQAPQVNTSVALGTTTKVRLDFFANDPTTVDANFIKNVAGLSLGKYETYARMQDGSVWQWGAQGGVLNNPSTVARVFTGLTNAAKIVVGGNFACALTATGTVSCWGGTNSRGQLGPGVAINGSSSIPVNVPLPGTSKGIDIAAGTTHVCVVTDFGGVACWGDDTYGQLGIDPTTLPAGAKYQATPGYAFNQRGARVFAGGDSTCVWDGTLACMGRNDLGQLGNGNTSSWYAPSTLSSRGIVDVAMGDNHTCVLHADGTVGCWGYNASGQVGDNTTVNKTVEFKVFQANGGATAIATGANHSCMLSATDQSSASRVLTCWGDNLYGQLGDPAAVNRLTPSPRFGGVVGLFAHGGDSTCIELQGGLQVQCTGYNANGQLGDGTRDTRFTYSNVTF